MNITLLYYAVGMGFGNAASILVGRQIGAGNLQEAKLYYKSLKMSTSISLFLVAFCVYFFKNPIIKLFNPQEETEEVL